MNFTFNKALIYIAIHFRTTCPEILLKTALASTVERSILEHCSVGVAQISRFREDKCCCRGSVATAVVLSMREKPIPRVRYFSALETD